MSRQLQSAPVGGARAPLRSRPQARPVITPHAPPPPRAPPRPHLDRAPAAGGSCARPRTRSRGRGGRCAGRGLARAARVRAPRHRGRGGGPRASSPPPLPQRRGPLICGRANVATSQGRCKTFTFEERLCKPRGRLMIRKPGRGADGAAFVLCSSLPQEVVHAAVYLKGGRPRPAKTLEGKVPVSVAMPTSKIFPPSFSE